MLRAMLSSSEWSPRWGGDKWLPHRETSAGLEDLHFRAIPISMGFEGNGSMSSEQRQVFCSPLAGDKLVAPSVPKGKGLVVQRGLGSASQGTTRLSPG